MTCTDFNNSDSRHFKCIDRPGGKGYPMELIVLQYTLTCNGDGLDGIYVYSLL